MSKQLQSARSASHVADTEPTLADLLDPVALEARLADARARRAAVIAQRNAGTAPAAPSREILSEPPRSVPVARDPPPDPIQLIEPAEPAAAKRRLGSAKNLLLVAIFLFGLIGGGAAVLFAPPDLRQRIADAIAPDADKAAPAIAAGVTASSVSPTAMAEVPDVPAAGPIPSVGMLPGESEVALVLVAPGSPTVSPVEDLPDLPIAVPGQGPVRIASPDALDPIDQAPNARITALDDFSDLKASEPGPLRPPAGDTGSPAVTSRLAALATPSAAPSTPPSPAPPDTAAIGGARVFVHYPPDAARAAAAAVETLQAAGAAAATAMPVHFSIERANVRYYHAADRAAALGIAEALNAGADGDAAEARDFTDFRPRPDPGLIEVWLAGAAPPTSTGSGTSTPPRTSARQPASAPRKPAVASAAAQLKAETIERIVLQRAVERMLRERVVAD